MFNVLTDHIKRECPDYPEAELNQLFRCLEVMEIPKKTLLMHAGKISSHAYFVVKGCFRYYTLNADGNEIITLFAFEDWWVGDIQSTLLNAPSKVNLESLEDCTVLAITSRNFNYLLQNSPAFAEFQQKKRAKAYQSAIDRTTNLRESAEKRYEALLEKYPQAAQRIPQYHIASYLGITPESLSRLRKKIIG